MSYILFLTNGKRDTVMEGQYRNDIVACTIYRSENRAMRLIGRKLTNIIPFLGKYFFGKWAEELAKYDIIICEGLKGKKNVFHYISKYKSNNTRIIMWHWNKIYRNEIEPCSEFAKQYEQWSFDPDDCAKYDMHFNTQYFGYCQDINDESPELNCLYFLGTDKGRGIALNSIKELCDHLNLSTNFIVVKGKQSSNQKRFDYNGKYSKSITYRQNISNIIKCSIILDLPMAGQTGLTLRLLEGLFLKRKVVTTNPQALYLSFYNPNNIFILKGLDYSTGTIDNYDAISNRLKTFIMSSYAETEENRQARDYYSFTSWAERFR